MGFFLFLFFPKYCKLEVLCRDKNLIKALRSEHKGQTHSCWKSASLHPSWPAPAGAGAETTSLSCNLHLPDPRRRQGAAWDVTGICLGASFPFGRGQGLPQGAQEMFWSHSIAKPLDAQPSRSDMFYLTFPAWLSILLLFDVCCCFLRSTANCINQVVRS